MKKILLLASFWIFTCITVNAQNFSFSCTRDTLMPCGSSCITLRTTIPNIKDLSGTSGDYVINPVSGSGISNGCFRPDIQPNG
ncbi:MAG: hypothetical protein ABUT20_35700, partial [Bacteroidota bacterium]